MPPGQYQLEVHSTGGGGGGPRRMGPGSGSGALHSEPITVTRGGPPVERTIEVTTGTLALRVVDADGNPVDRARVTLVLAADVPPDSKPSDWRSAASLQRFGLRNGELTAANVPPGAYRFAVEGRDIETLLGDVAVLASATPSQPLTVVAKPRAAGAPQQAAPQQAGQRPGPTNGR